MTRWHHDQSKIKNLSNPIQSPNGWRHWLDGYVINGYYTNTYYITEIAYPPEPDQIRDNQTHQTQTFELDSNITKHHVIITFSTTYESYKKGDIYHSLRNNHSNIIIQFHHPHYAVVDISYRLGIITLGFCKGFDGTLANWRGGALSIAVD